MKALQLRWRPRALLFAIFAAGFAASCVFISTDDDAASIFAQLAAGFTLEGAVLVTLFAIAEDTIAHKASVHRSAQIKAAALEIVSPILVWITSAGEESEEAWRVRCDLLRPQISRILSQAYAMLPAIAEIDIPHLVTWRNLLEILAQLADSDDTAPASELFAAYRATVSHFDHK